MTAKKQDRAIAAAVWEAAAAELEAQADRFYKNGDVATYNTLTALADTWRARRTQ